MENLGALVANGYDVLQTKWIIAAQLHAAVIDDQKKKLNLNSHSGSLWLINIPSGSESSHKVDNKGLVDDTEVVEIDEEQDQIGGQLPLYEIMSLLPQQLVALKLLIRI